MKKPKRRATKPKKQVTPPPLAPPPSQPSSMRRIARGMRLGWQGIVRGIGLLSVIGSLAAAYYYFQPGVSIDVNAASVTITNLNPTTLYDLHAQLTLYEVTSIGTVGVPPVTVQLWNGGLARPEYLPRDSMVMLYSQIQARNPRPTIILKPAPGDSIALSTLKEWSASKMPQYLGKLTIQMDDIASLLPQPVTEADFVLTISYWSYIPLLLRISQWFYIPSFYGTATWEIFTRPRQGGGVDWRVRPHD